MRRMRPFAGVPLSVLMGIAGCRVGPDYKVPAMPAPPAYSDNGRTSEWQPASPADAVNRGPWWTVFGDSELDALEDRCTQANQNIAAALHAYEQAHDLVRENRAARFPTVSIGAQASRGRVSSSTPLRTATSAADYWEFLIPLNVSWEPDLWGGIRRQIESSSANAQASAAQLANTRLSLQAMLAVTYFQLHGLDLQAQLLRATVDAFTQSLQLTQVRMKGGVSTQIDVEESQAQLEQARAEQIDLGVQRAQYEHAIAVLVGVPATGFTISERPLAGVPPAIPTGVPSQLLQRRPDIAAAERQVAAANAQIGVAQAAFYPNIQLGATAGIESDSVSQLFNTGSAQWNVGPSASQVLFDAGRRRAQMDYAVAQRDQAAALYRQQVLSAFRDVEDQLSTLRLLEEEIAVQQRAVDAARRSTALATLRYKSGLSTYLEVLTNQTTELNDERVAASLIARRYVATAQLQLALGGGWNSSQLPSN